MTTVDVIDTYVHTLERLLPGPRGPRAEMLRELADGLHDAASAHESAGLSRAEAERRAVEESGAPDELAPDYREVLVAAQGKRTARLFALGSLASLAAWNLVWRLPGTDDGSPSPLVVWVFRLIDYATYASAGVALLALGLLTLAARTRWSARRIVSAQATLGTASVLAVLVCCVGGNLLNVVLTQDVPRLPPVVWFLGAGSVALLVWQLLSARRSRRTSRQALPTADRATRTARAA